MQPWKRRTQVAYDTYAETLASRYERSRERIGPQIEQFLNELPGERVLDLASGPGVHAEEMKQRGADVICGELSEEMVRLCQEKGLTAQQMDMEFIPLEDGAVDGVWLMAAFFHVPKERAAGVLAEVHRVLRKNGVLSLGVKQGDTEGMVDTDPDAPDAPRWFSFYTDEEIRDLVEPYFDIVNTRTKAVTPEKIYLNYLLRKKGEV